MNKKIFSVYLPVLFLSAVLIFGALYLYYTSRIRVACVGDSITYGAKLKDRKENCYPACLQALLGSKYIVENFGVSGHTLQDTGDRPYRSTECYQDSLDFKPNVVLIMLGTNDTKIYNWVDVQAYLTAYRNLIANYLSLPSKPDIYLMTPAAIYPENFIPAKPYQMQAEMADEAAEAVRQLALEQNLPLIDIHALTAEHPEYFLRDGVHPDAIGAKAIAGEVWKKLLTSCS